MLVTCQNGLSLFERLNFGRSFVVCTVVQPLATTEKVFAKGGLNWTKSSISTNRSECFFRGTKLRKNCGTKKQARLNATGSSIITSTPPFANTMLAEGLFQSSVIICSFVLSFKIIIFSGINLFGSIFPAGLIHSLTPKRKSRFVFGVVNFISSPK